MSRVASAIVLVAVVGVVVWLLPSWVTIVVAALAAGLAAHELATMASQAGATISRTFVAGCAATVTAAFAARPLLQGATAPLGVSADILTIALLTSVIAASALTLSRGGPAPTTMVGAAVMMMAPLYVGLPMGALAWVQVREGPHALTWLVAVIAISDSAQYYTGRRFGRRKLAPLVSPAKTVEGAIGGLIVAAMAGGLLAPFGLPGEAPMVGVALALLLSITGMVGDLFESLLKRSVGIKDSSSLIPGHGGVLDRVDSHLLATPVFYVYLLMRG